jgi:hypothetical protein
VSTRLIAGCSLELVTFPFGFRSIFRSGIVGVYRGPDPSVSYTDHPLTAAKKRL